MSDVLIQHDTKIGDDAMVDALTSDRPSVRIVARAAAASWSQLMTEWINDELNRPKAEPVDVLYALASLQIQTFASMACQVVGQGGYSHAVNLYQQMVKDDMLEHMRRTAAMVAARRRT